MPQAIKLTCSLGSAATLSSAPGAVSSYASPTLDWIPGTSVLGALAARWRKQNGPSLNEKDFRDTFCSDSVRFETLLPVAADGHTVRPIPLSAHTCKSRPGWDAAAHGVVDLLLCDAVPTECAVEGCGSPLEQYAGLCAGNAPGQFAKFVHDVQMTAHNELDDETVTTREGRLFSRSGIAQASQFVGAISGDNPALAHLSNPGALRVGQNTRKRGVLEIDSWLAGQSNFDYVRNMLGYESGVQARFDTMNPTPEQKDVLFTLTLVTDTILVDDWLRPVTVLDEDALKLLPGCPQLDVKLKRAFCRSRRVSGWYKAHEMPRMDDLAISAGSCASFVANVTDSAGRDSLIDWLKGLEGEGLGLRRNEGFGRIVVCDPFHLQQANP